MKREESRWGFHISQAKFGTDPILRKAPKKYVVQYYQFKVRHRVIKIFLAKI